MISIVNQINKYEELGIEDRIEKSVLEQIECSICYGILKTPRQCFNGHLYCLDCINRQITNTVSQNRCCPLCKSPLDTLCRSLFLENFLSTYKINCKYHYKYSENGGWSQDQLGCNEKLTLDGIEGHESTCIHRLQLCQFNSDCGYFRIVELSNHHQQCPHGKSDLKFEDLKIKNKKLKNKLNEMKEKIKQLEKSKVDDYSCSNFLWNINNVSQKLDPRYYGMDSFKSSTIDLGGGGDKWYFQLSVDNDGGVFVGVFAEKNNYLSGTIQVKCRFKFKFDGHQISDKKKVTYLNGKEYSSFLMNYNTLLTQCQSNGGRQDNVLHIHCKVYVSNTSQLKLFNSK